MKKPITIAAVALILLAAFLASPLHAGLNDKAAIAKSSGKYKGFWKNKTAFPGTGFFNTDDPLGSGDFKIEGMIRLPRNPKNLKFKQPASIGVEAPVTKMKITKTIVRRCGKFIKHVGTGKQNNAKHFGAGALLSGKGNVTLKARGNKFVAKGKFSGKDATPVMAGPNGPSPRKVKGNFKGKG